MDSFHSLLDSFLAPIFIPEGLSGKGRKSGPTFRNEEHKSSLLVCVTRAIWSESKSQSLFDLFYSNKNWKWTFTYWKFILLFGLPAVKAPAYKFL